MKNIVERPIVPYNIPANKTIFKEGYNLFAPIAANGKPGMAGFNPEHFDIRAQIVSISEKYKQQLFRVIDVDTLKTLCKLANIPYSDDLLISDVLKEIPTIEQSGDNYPKIKVYDSKGTNLQTLHSFEDDAGKGPSSPNPAYLIVQRDGTGNIVIPEATKSYHAVPLKQLEKYFDNPSLPKYNEKGNLTSGDAINDLDVVNKKYLKDNAVTKDENGDVTIKGNLHLSGEAKYIDTDVLKVDSSINILNSDYLDGEGDDTWTTGGTVIMLSETKAYGIVYNNYYKRVMIGYGTVSNGKFMFDEFDEFDEFGKSAYSFVLEWDGNTGEEGEFLCFNDQGKAVKSGLKTSDIGKIQTAIKDIKIIQQQYIGNYPGGT